MTGFVQQGAVAAAASGTLAPTITSVTAGNTLIAIYAVNNGNTIAAPTDSNGSQTWTIRGQFHSGECTIVCAYLFNANAGTHTLTWATQSAASESNISEWNGITAVGSTPVSSTGSSVATLTSASYTPSQANEVVIAACTEFGTSNPDNIHCTTAAFQGIGTTTDSGGAGKDCIGVEQNGSSFGVYEANADIVTSASALTCAWSWTGANSCVSIVAGFEYTPATAGQSPEDVIIAPWDDDVDLGELWLNEAPWSEPVVASVAANGALNVEDAFDHWGNEDDEQIIVDAFAFINSDQLVALPDAWDHWLTDDDEQWLFDEAQPFDGTQYFGDEWLDQDDDEQVFVDDCQSIDVAPAQQYFGEDAELLDNDDDEQVFVDDYALIENLSPFTDGWDHFTTDEDDYFVPDNSPTDGGLQYYGEDAELLDQEDDDQVIVDSQPTLPGDAPIEDGWDHFATDDDDQVDTVEFALISVAVTALQYYGEDSELLDQDDDDQVNVDESNVQNATLAQTFDDPWEHWPTEDDDYAVTDDYASVDNNPVICIADAWDWAEQGDEEAPVPEDYQPVAIASSAPEDPWDHFPTEDDDQAFVDELPSGAAVVNALLNTQDAWDHFTTDEDDYVVIDDYEVPATFTLTLSGCAFGGGLSFGTAVLLVPSGPPRYPQRFFNGSNAWLGFRTASGGGVW